MHHVGRLKILKKAVRVNIVLDREDYELAREVAKAQQVSVSELIRRLIRAYATHGASAMVNNINAPLESRKAIKIDLEKRAKAIELLNVIRNIISLAIKDRNISARRATAMKLIEKLVKLLESVGDDSIMPTLLALMKMVSGDDIESWTKARALIDELESGLMGGS